MAAARHLLAAVVLWAAFSSAASFTDPSDAIGMWELYRTLELPWQLSGWTSMGGDPCGGDGELGSWQGVFCKDSNISGLRVGGWLGPELLKLHSLKELNIENNHFSGYVPGTFEFIPELRFDGNHFQPVHKPNEVLYSWSSLMMGRDTSSSNNNSIKPGRVSKRKSLAKTSKNLVPAKQFLAVDILAATRNFNEECLIGEGITGRVYRGDFPAGQLLAIKKINMIDLSLSEQDELMDILWNMSRLKHPNISSLVGYCVEFGHCALLYEYAENGSLDDLLFSSATRSRALSWKARMKIALGVAYALEYMHLMCSPPVAHGNIKATNILLDAQLMPYLSHCGLGKFSHFVSATRMDSEALSGAKGYAAPEANGSGTDIIKADIYSFGVLLLVLLTGQKAFDSSRRHNEQFLVDWASPHLHNLDSLEGITDPRICGHMPPKAISALGNIILLCIKPVRLELIASSLGGQRSALLLKLHHIS
ncbi:hypothetical protein ACQ4PT_007144 [Festuca glaucescens]